MGFPKIAILILAHKNQEQLMRLVNHLKTFFSVYVHIDRKSKIEINNETNVYSVKKYKVYWGSYNQILAIRELMKIASSKQHERYILISGQDLPIMSNQEIVRFFDDNANIYLHGSKLPRNDWKHKGGFERMQLYYLYWRREKMNNVVLKLMEKIEGMVHKIQHHFKLYRKIPNNLYGGWEWFNLTHDAVVVCLNKMYQARFIRLFKYTMHANEIIIQSILYNSNIASLCINDSLRYVDLNYHGEHPNIITIRDLETVKSSGNIFARKFDNKVDSEVIDKIYDRIN